MTPRTVWSIILLALTYPVHEFWQVFRESSREVNWWIALDYPLSIQWYFKFLGIEISQVIISIVLYRLSYKIRDFHNAAIVFLIYTLIDLAMFFVNFNRASYALILSTVGLVSMVVIYRKTLSNESHRFFNRMKIKAKKKVLPI